MFLAVDLLATAELQASLLVAAARAGRLADDAVTLAALAHLDPLAPASQVEREAAAAVTELGRRVLALTSHLLRPGPHCPSLTAPDLTWLSCDPRGDGRAVVVVGAPLATADQIAVLVPGVGTALDALADEVERARNLAAAAGPDTAVVVWAGYDAPGWLQAGSQGAAADGADDLARFLRSLPTGRRVTVIGHSYGSLVASHALRKGGRADATVLIGSPGVGVERAAALLAGGDVYVLKAPGDVIASLGAFGGVDPAASSFGAIRLTTTGAQGHSAYLDTGTASLANVAAVVRGNVSDLDTQHATEADTIAEQLGRVIDSADDVQTAARRTLDLPWWGDAPLAGLQRATNGGGQLASRAIANGIADLHDLWDHAVGAIGWG